MTRILIICTALLFFNQNTEAQHIKKQIPATRTDNPPKIDGLLNDVSWRNATIATDFIQYEPFNGLPESKRSEVKLVYDNIALYIGAIFYDDSPDSILTELGERDADMHLNADQIMVDINPFNDGVYGLSFKVSASGVQTDIKRSPAGSVSTGGGRRGGWGRAGRDLTWDAVWQSEVNITDSGWVAELKIPYSAIRFPKKDNQIWGLNIWREIRRYRELSSWNFVDRNVGTTVNHLGELTGISNISPPIRLSFMPYLSGYLEKDSEISGWLRSYNGGMDVKYGLNESFTMDMTLIPDFGQVQSDDIVLNLTPYEVKYNEKRYFFTEGTELFNKGGLFYSRRIGSTPNGYYDAYDNLLDNEKIVKNPPETNLINATKISGRTINGFGIGLFNAMTSETFAIANDTLAEIERKIRTQPFTNYNMIVFDQSLKNNSYISLVNTNVLRREDNFSANVTGTEFRIANKGNIYSISGSAAISQKYNKDVDTDLGYTYYFKVGKTGGNFRYEYSQDVKSDTYDPNDMGFLQKNNTFSNKLTLSYNYFQPVWKLISTRNTLSFTHSNIYSPREYNNFVIDFNSMNTFRSYLFTGIFALITPFGTDDYFEPRVAGRFYRIGPGFTLNTMISTDRRKMIYSRFNIRLGKIYSDYDQHEFGWQISPTIRINDKFSISHELEYNRKFNDIGYVDNINEDTIYFGKRLSTTISNTLNANYNFNDKSYISFRLRHYWSRADYNGEYYMLGTEGDLLNSSYSGDHDINFNIFNIDMVYTWRFSPGSELNIVWKNSIYQYGSDIIQGFFNNFEQTLDSPQINSFSIKVLYYLDYQSLRR